MTEIQTILEKCKKKDGKAQATLYNWLAPKLLGLCLRYMQDRDEAEDVMQDSFVKIFTQLHSYRGEGSFEGWAKRVAVNTALTALKKKKGIYFERNLTVVESIDFSEDEHQHLNIAEITACMESLAPGYRTIVNLFLVEGFSHREIAEQLDITESTSRSQYARARQALMKLLKEKTQVVPARNA